MNVTIEKNTPSAEIINTTNAIETISAGSSTLGLRKPNVLQQYRMVELAGDSAKNEVYMAMIMPILWVVEINGEPQQPTPSTKRELEALIQRLGEEGISALMSHFTPKEGSEAESDVKSGQAVKN
jgi:hypothetical protein